MTADAIHILLIEDNPGDAYLIRALLSEAGGEQFSLEWLDRLAAGLGRLAGERMDLVLLDLSLPDSQSLATLHRVAACAPGVPVVVLTGLNDEDVALQAMQAGAQDYLVKGQVDGPGLVRALRYAIERQRLREQLERTTAALQASEARLAAVIDTAMDAIVTADAAQRIIRFNAAAEAMFRCSAAEVLGQPLDRLVPAALRDAHQGHIARFGASGDTSRVVGAPGHITGLRADGETFPIELSISQTEAAGERVYTAIMRDITERLSQEQALSHERELLAQRVEERTLELRVANAELARAARLKDEFLANMSHELRTPLNAVLGLSETLREQTYGPLSSRQLRAIEMIEESGTHLLELINDILDLAKVGADKLSLDYSPLAVEQICESSRRLVAQTANRKQLSVKISLADPALVICADVRRLKQILVNLLSNAVKFTPAGGAIGLEVTSDAELQTVTFVVWDTGIGISAADMARLFQPFTQIDAGLNRQFQGTGLGLALVERLTRLHGGEVAVESTPGQGSRFSVTLPWNLERKSESTG